jgi:hypothetical protein
VAGDDFLKLGASMLENSFFTKSILRKMLLCERLRNSILLCIWLGALIYKDTNLEIWILVSQIIFGEYVIFRWARMEWLRISIESVYTNIYTLILTTSDYSSKEFRACVVQGLIRYETGKAQAGISISTRLFNKMNADLSNQWASISRMIGLNTVNLP